MRLASIISQQSLPLLDEDDASNREWDAASESWESMSVRERVKLIQERGHGCSVFAARRDELPRDDNGGIFDYLRTP